mmetsp:Transcript_83500/g.162439  ORF Transcript_83500/g.162439 Transcript_83500/m.162439 type:complete len:203 (+) Transcript_83500:90-698(+)
MANFDLFGISTGPHKPVESTICGSCLGFVLGCANEWKRPQLATSSLRRVSSVRAGATVGVSFGIFIALYTGTAVMVRDFRNAVEKDEFDIPASVVGGGIAGLSFGLRGGPRAGAVGLAQGAALGFACGALQNLLIKRIRLLEAAAEAEKNANAEGGASVMSVAVDDSQTDARREGQSESEELARYMESLSKRMEEVSKTPQK